MIPVAFGSISFVIALLFSDWIRSTVNGFSAPHAQYCSLNQEISVLTQHVYNLVLGLRATVDTDDATREYALRITQVLSGMCIYAYRLFTLDDTSVRLDAYMPPDSEASQHVAMWCHSDTQPFVVFQAMLSSLEELLSALELVRGTKPINVSTIHSALDRIRAILKDVTISAHVKTPSLFRHHFRFTIMAFFIAITPYSFAIQFSDAAYVLYPALMYLLFVVFIDRHFLGDAFVAPKEFSHMDPREWRDRELGRIQMHYRTWIGVDGTHLIRTPQTTNYQPPIGSAGSTRAAEHQVVYNASTALSL
jgi:hypothetical protein